VQLLIFLAASYPVYLSSVPGKMISGKTLRLMHTAILQLDLNYPGAPSILPSPVAE